MRRLVLLVACSLLAFAAGCSSEAPANPTATSTMAATNAAPTYTATATATVLPAASGPVIATYARGETVKVPRGTLFLDPKTGGGEAWADVGVSPSGRFAPWYGGDGKQPPVLYETLTRRRIELDTGGQPGQVIKFSPEEDEVAVRVGDEVRIASTADGSVRVSLPGVTGGTAAGAFWGPGGAVAVTYVGPQGRDSRGVVAWWKGTVKTYPDVQGLSWFDWAPDGNRFVTSTAEETSATTVVDLSTGAINVIDQVLYNPRWSASGEYIAGQLPDGRSLVLNADGTPHMRLNGVCAVIGSPWVEDEIIPLAGDLAVAMDGSTRAYMRPSNTANLTTFAPNNGVALLDPGGSTTLAELKVADSIPVSGYLGFPWVTPDGRGKLQLGVGGKGACENVGAFKVEMAPFD